MGAARVTPGLLPQGFHSVFTLLAICRYVVRQKEAHGSAAPLKALFGIDFNPRAGSGMAERRVWSPLHLGSPRFQIILPVTRTCILAVREAVLGGLEIVGSESARSCIFVEYPARNQTKPSPPQRCQQDCGTTAGQLRILHSEMVRSWYS